MATTIRMKKRLLVKENKMASLTLLATLAYIDAFFKLKNNFVRFQANTLCKILLWDGRYKPRLSNSVKIYFCLFPTALRLERISYLFISFRTCLFELVAAINFSVIRIFSPNWETSNETSLVVPFR